MRASVSLFLAAIVLAGATHLSRAQQPTAAQSSIKTQQSATPDLTVNALISEVAAKRSFGSPQGTHLLVKSSVQTLDVSVGPYLSPELKAKMFGGSNIQIKGFMKSAGGKSYLMAREISLGGQKYTIRNENGLLVHYISQVSPGNKPGSRRAHGQQIGGGN